MPYENFDSEFGIMEFKWHKPIAGRVRLKTVRRFDEFLSASAAAPNQVTELAWVRNADLVLYPPATVPFLHVTFAETVKDKMSALDFVSDYGFLNPEFNEHNNCYEQRIDDVIESAKFIKGILGKASYLNLQRLNLYEKSESELKSYSTLLLASVNEFSAPQLKLCTVPMDGNPHHIVPKFIPHTLLDYLLVHCIFEITGTYIIRPCLGCGRPLQIDANSAKALARQHCPREKGNPKCAQRAKRNKAKGIKPTWRYLQWQKEV